MSVLEIVLLALLLIAFARSVYYHDRYCDERRARRAYNRYWISADERARHLATLMAMTKRAEVIAPRTPRAGARRRRSK